MKINNKLIYFSVIILAAAGVFCVHQHKTQLHGGDIALANIEALTYDLEEVTVMCSSGNQGYCFREDWTQWKMCREYTYHPCVYTGYQSDHCYHPC